MAMMVKVRNQQRGRKGKKKGSGSTELQAKGSSCKMLEGARMQAQSNAWGRGFNMIPSISRLGREKRLFGCRVYLVSASFPY